MADQATTPKDVPQPMPTVNGSTLDVEMKDEAAQEVSLISIYLRHDTDEMLRYIPPQYLRPL
jgi:hypothetical protein